jgi:hypothetical protein
MKFIRKIKVILLFSTLFFALFSCVEIIDDITIHKDGSGVWKLKINLSESLVKINSVLALDSINGYKVPNKAEIHQHVVSFKNALANQDGIKSATIQEDLEHYVWNISVEFNTTQSLEIAVVNALKDQKINGVKIPVGGIVRKSGDIITKQFPFDLMALKSKVKEEDWKRLSEGKYISIMRFDTEILKNSNERYSISKNNMATMAAYSIGECLEHPSIINNQTQLK